MSKVFRSFRFDEHTIYLIDELKERSGLENNSAVIRRALTLFKFAHDAKKESGKLIVRTLDGDSEIVL